MSGFAPPVGAIVIGTAGHPTSGAWAAGQIVMDSNGVLWVCTVSGSPGTWVEITSGAGAAMTLVATTGAAGVGLINGTQTILTWTAPNDGNLHYAQFCATMVVSVNQTGGACQVNGQAPTGAVSANPIFAGSLGAGVYLGNNNDAIATFAVGPGKTASLTQQTAQTLGTAVIYAALFAS